MNSFSKAHPTVQLLFFAVVIIVSISFANPLISAVSLAFAVLFNVVNNMKRGVKSLLYSLAVIIAVGVFNMLFAHYGETTLFKIKDAAFTLEALAFGLNQGVTLCASVIWFTCLGRCLDSERIMYLFRFSPKLVTLFSMVLGFIPRFIKKLGDIRDAKIGLLGGRQPQGIKEKLESAIDNISALVTYSLESSILTADSMSARGYNPKAVRASRFSFSNRDFILLTLILVMSFETVFQKALGNLNFAFEPKVQLDRVSIPALVAFAVLSALPSVIDLWENIKWKQLSAKA